MAWVKIYSESYKMFFTELIKVCESEMKDSYTFSHLTTSYFVSLTEGEFILECLIKIVNIMYLHEVNCIKTEKSLETL